VKLFQRRVLIFVVAGAGILTVLFFLLVWWRTWNPSPFDDGPFGGVQHQPPSGQPVQEFRIWAGRRLLVYPRSSTELAPVVVLKAEDGQVAWSIEARGREGCQVNSLRFDRYSTRPWIWPRVIGLVDWNCGGREQAVWKLRRDGSLKEYWYSW
jgi:hypothetical protein